MSALQLKALDKKQKRYAVTFNEFGGMGSATGTKRLLALESINCDCRDGALSVGFGVEVYKKDLTYVPSKTGAVRFFIVDAAERLDSSPKTVLFCLTESGGLYRFDEEIGGFVFELTVSPYSQMVCVAEETGKKVWIVSRNQAYYAYADGAWKYFGLANATPNMCVCKDRVFLALEKATVVYSDPAATYDFRGGNIHLAYDFGEIVGMLCFKNQVYVLHQFGVARIDVKGDAEQFEIQPLDYVGGEIYGTSALVCGEAIFFLAADGVYRFDGTRFERVEGVGRIVPKASEKFCQVSFFDGHYLLQYTAADGLRRAVAIAADGKSGYAISEREGLSYSGGAALFQSSGYVWTFRGDGEFTSTEKGRFTTQRTDFGVQGRKTLRAVHVRGRGLVDVRIGTDGLEKEYALAFKHGVASVDLRALGESFYFSFALGKGARMQEVSVEFSVAKGG